MNFQNDKHFCFLFTEIRFFDSLNNANRRIINNISVDIAQLQSFFRSYNHTFLILLILHIYETIIILPQLCFLSRAEIGRYADSVRKFKDFYNSKKPYMFKKNIHTNIENRGFANVYEKSQLPGGFAFTAIMFFLGFYFIPRLCPLANAKIYTHTPP